MYTNQADLDTKLKIVTEFLKNSGYAFAATSINHHSHFVRNMEVFRLTGKNIIISIKNMRCPITNYELQQMIVIEISGLTLNNEITLPVDNTELHHTLREAFMYLEINGLIKEDLSLSFNSLNFERAVIPKPNIKGE